MEPDLRSFMILPSGRPKPAARPQPKTAYVRVITEYTKSTAASGGVRRFAAGGDAPSRTLLGHAREQVLTLTTEGEKPCVELKKLC